MHVIFDESDDKSNYEHKEDLELEELIKGKHDKTIQNPGSNQVARENGVELTEEPGPSDSAQEALLSQNLECEEDEICC